MRTQRVDGDPGGSLTGALSMATGEDLRRIAMTLEGTTEAPHFDRAAFKVQRIYGTLAADGRTANLKFRRDDQDFKCMVMPEAFAPLANAWGRQGWTVADLSKLKESDLRNALELAWTDATRPKRPRRS
jgi:hypothetical protein